MNRTWKFTDIEFDALWSRTRADILPRPFVIVTDIPYENDYQRELHRIREQWQFNGDPAFDQICADVLEPDLSLVVRGIDGQDPRNPKGSIRKLAVRRKDRGYLLTQLPGKTVAHSAGFTVTECDPLSLASVVVAELPEVAAGKHAQITLPMPREGGEMDHSYDKSGLWDSFEDTNQRAAEWFESTVPTTRGAIGVFQGISIFGPRGRVSRWLQWRDLPDDGRYVIGADLPPVAEPADAKRFAAMINTEIVNVIRVIKDERKSARNPTV
ncbi:ESX secretion-associated protein EspG [Nocardia sp. NBC_01730]|uniref:ESX secretion-associated protein EspG n=1 Tax=Nocardia sp. NBC_01730 TaxID=2975998 RepID=UPI002E0EDE21|nr:ESX secretion-associated protein EspG [Nocardia sp. NBC_01730]